MQTNKPKRKRHWKETKTGPGQITGNTLCLKLSSNEFNQGFNQGNNQEETLQIIIEQKNS